MTGSSRLVRRRAWPIPLPGHIDCAPLNRQVPCRVTHSDYRAWHHVSLSSSSWCASDRSQCCRAMKRTTTPGRIARWYLTKSSRSTLANCGHHAPASSCLYQFIRFSCWPIRYSACYLHKTKHCSSFEWEWLPKLTASTEPATSAQFITSTFSGPSALASTSLSSIWEEGVSLVASWGTQRESSLP